ncbi:MAG TPA: 2Fe-2S iron-sulfur cluster-binding protein [Chitinophagales bacterium]|nr:2Fe-2S iron-sulfur cluster-binding protein [Chitinophagales bacterium]
MESIKIYIQNKDNSETEIEIPLGISMSLMEILKGENYPVEAVCGGMALCATCRVEVLNDTEVSLEEPSDAELLMLESLPDFEDNNRLACQINISDKLNNLRIKFPEEVFV